MLRLIIPAVNAAIRPPLKAAAVVRATNGHHATRSFGSEHEFAVDPARHTLCFGFDRSRDVRRSKLPKQVP